MEKITPEILNEIPSYGQAAFRDFYFYFDENKTEKHILEKMNDY
jgi:hypothetical protein